MWYCTILTSFLQKDLSQYDKNLDNLGWNNSIYMTSFVAIDHIVLQYHILGYIVFFFSFSKRKKKSCIIKKTKQNKDDGRLNVNSCSRKKKVFTQIFLLTFLQGLVHSVSNLTSLMVQF